MKNASYKVLFLHGLESAPGGTKPSFLTESGFEVINPALPKESFDRSVQIAQDIVNHTAPDVIVGSSRGGAVAMAIDPQGAKRVLIAPAYKKYCVSPVGIDESVTILHSVCDDIIPLTDSVELSTGWGCRIYACGADHRMSDSDALKMLKAVISESR
jgi:hypothetical protein